MVSNKKRRKEEKKAKKVEVTTTPPTALEAKVPTLKRVFIFDNLNTHQRQREVWEQAKNGEPFTLLDYELKMYDNGTTYIEKRIGEAVAGKVYLLTEEQVSATDWYETEENERISVTQDTKSIEVYRKVRSDK